MPTAPGAGRVALLAGTAFAMIVATQPVRADFAESLIGSTIGTIIGNEIHRNATRPRTRVVVRERTRTRVVRPRADTYTRAQNRETQVALNYFGFNSGSPDGVLGRRSRAAIRRYQAFTGYPVTGYLAAPQRAFLVASYHRALAGGVKTERLVARRGTSGLLTSYNDERLGSEDRRAADASSVGTRPGEDADRADFDEDRDGMDDDPIEVAAVEDEDTGERKPGLTLFKSEETSPSIAKFCARTGIHSAASGGLLPASSLADSEEALAEQFCLLSSEATVVAATALEGVEGATPEAIQATCENFLPELKPFTVQLGTRDAAEMTGPLNEWAVNTGVDLAGLGQTAQICLGHAYDQDNAEMAVSASLALVAVGEENYGELLAAHLVHGFGVKTNRSRAAGWYDLSAAALEGGAEPIMVVDGLDRTEFLRNAARRMRGDPVEAATELEDGPSTTLTTFDKKPTKAKD